MAPTVHVLFFWLKNISRYLATDGGVGILILNNGNSFLCASLLRKRSQNRFRVNNNRWLRKRRKNFHLRLLYRCSFFSKLLGLSYSFIIYGYSLKANYLLTQFRFQSFSGIRNIGRKTNLLNEFCI